MMSSVRNGLRSGDPSFVVTHSDYPNFMYEGDVCPSDPVDSLDRVFRGQYLYKVGILPPHSFAILTSVTMDRRILEYFGAPVVGLPNPVGTGSLASVDSNKSLPSPSHMPLCW